MGKATTKRTPKRKPLPPAHEYQLVSLDVRTINGLAVVGWRVVAVYRGEVLMERERV